VLRHQHDRRGDDALQLVAGELSLQVIVGRVEEAFMIEEIIRGLRKDMSMK